MNRTQNAGHSQVQGLCNYAWSECMAHPQTLHSIFTYLSVQYGKVGLQAEQSKLNNRIPKEQILLEEEKLIN